MKTVSLTSVMREQKINRIPAEVAVPILSDYFKECGLDIKKRTNAFGRIILSQLIGDTYFLVSDGRFVEIQGYFNHARGSGSSPTRAKDSRKMSCCYDTEGKNHGRGTEIH